MNVTGDNPTSSVAVVVMRTVFIAVNGLAVVLANVLTIVILGRAQVGSEPARIFISSLAMADVLVGGVAFASTVPSGHDGFPFSEGLCRIVGSIFAVGLLLSILFLAVISVDRYLAVVVALRYEALVTRQRALVTVVLCWLCMVSLVTVVVALRPDLIAYNDATFFCEPAFEDPAFPLSLFVAIVAWIAACSLTMMATYSRLFVTAHRHSRLIAAQETAAVAAQQSLSAPASPAAASVDRPRRRELKAVWMCLAVTLAFNLAWMPTLCLDFYKFVAKRRAAPGLEFAITWLSLSNSWWNFLIYSGMNKQFKDAAKQLARQVCGRCAKGGRREDDGRPRGGQDFSFRDSGRDGRVCRRGSDGQRVD